MKTKLLLFIFFCSYTINAQVKFEKGSFIDDANNKVECLIKNYDWVSTPSEIEYKISDGATVETKNFNSMNSFQVYNTSHYYKKAKINIDKNAKMSGFSPKIETTILKVIVEGEASLYSTSGIFFYQIKDQDIKQLLYKKYVDNNSRMKEDVTFRNELYNTLKCGDNLVEIRKVDYKKRDLINFFNAYNNCRSSESKVFSDAATKFSFDFNVIAGVSSNKSSFKRPFTKATGPVNGVYGTSLREQTETKNAMGFTLGFEVETILPFNKKKWSVFIAPNYQQLEYDLKENNVNINSQYGYGNLSVKAKYSYMEVPIGIRHYFNLNDTSKLFIDVAYNYVYVVNSEESEYFISRFGEEFTPAKQPDGDNPTTNVRFGLGYKFKNKYAIGFNYFSDKELSNSQINSFSLIASYTIF